MIFRRELAEKVMRGEKTVTRRAVSDNPRSPWWKERCRYSVGKVFTVNPGRAVPRIGEARVIACDQQDLGELSDAQARAEGCTSAQDFRETWVAINKRYETDARVWRVEFEVVCMDH
jgi:hypothetical protein